MPSFFKLLTPFVVGLALVSFVSGCSSSTPPQQSASTSADEPTDISLKDLPSQTPVNILSKASGQNRGGVIQTQPTDFKGITADLIECKRKNGILSVKIRFAQSSMEGDYLKLTSNYRNSNFEKYYVSADTQKFMLLKDGADNVLAAEPVAYKSLKKGENYYWWGRFLAPEVDVASVSINLPHILPFDDVTITDAG